ncbi:MAG: ATP-binding protein, partial [bacterium]
MSGLPTGTVTFLFADAEGSTDLLQRLGDEEYKHLLERLRQNLRSVFASHGGTEVDSRGEEFFVAFPGARDALIAAIDAQRRVALIHRDGSSVRLRIGLHTGEPVSTESGYVGIDVHRAARICAAGHGGQILVSQRTSDLLREDLPPEIGLVDLREHRLKDLQQPERLYQVIAPDLQDSFPPLRTLSVLPNNLPFQLTSFVGRLRQMDEIRQLLARHRLVTLTGIGGCGKTRLALQVAADDAEAFLHGVWLIDLNSITTGDLVLPTVVTTLQVREQPGRMLEATLVDFLQEKQLLLVLDNCEHLLDACAGVAHALLRRAPKLHILATSREPLRIQGEQRYEVPPLELPDLTAGRSSTQLTASEAVQLFVERAVLGQHRFALTDRNAQSVAQIVARLDGIPLAIELAAAKVKLLSTAQIAERLNDRFGLLAGGSRTALGRQQTLRAMIDWSYELLSESERLLLRRLSVFAGGFTLEAAEAIVAGVEIARHDFLDLLGRLVDKSLVIVDPAHGSRRYRLLDTMREYAKERLTAAGEVGPLRNAHRDWYLAFAQKAESSLDEPNQIWLNRLEADHDNLRAAIEYSLATDDAEGALRLGTALWRFWHVRGHWTEGRQRLEAAISAATRAQPSLRARALHAAGMLAQRQGDYERATTLSEESLTLQQTLGDAHGIATSLTTLGNIAYVQANYT